MPFLSEGLNVSFPAWGVPDSFSSCLFSARACCFFCDWFSNAEQHIFCEDSFVGIFARFGMLRSLLLSQCYLIQVLIHSVFVFGDFLRACPIELAIWNSSRTQPTILRFAGFTWCHHGHDC